MDQPIDLPESVEENLRSIAKIWPIVMSKEEYERMREFVLSHCPNFKDADLISNILMERILELEKALAEKDRSE